MVLTIDQPAPAGGLVALRVTDASEEGRSAKLLAGSRGLSGGDDIGSGVVDAANGVTAGKCYGLGISAERL